MNDDPVRDRIIDFFASYPEYEDYKELVVKLAKTRPLVFDELLSAPAMHSYRFTDDVKQIFVGQGKVQAIKFYRKKTGTALKDAKDAVEEICKGLSPPYPL